MQALSLVPLEWMTVGPWTYALGDFGVIKGFGGLSPWVVRIHGHVLGLYGTLSAARAAIESAARQAGHPIAR